jgi:iron complex outermembrane recepter protein
MSSKDISTLSFRVTRVVFLCLAICMMLFSRTVRAQTEGAVNASSEPSPSTLDEVLVTATKRATAERVQDVPFSIDAFSPLQLENIQMRTVADLSHMLPNMELSGVGTTLGAANFASRGLGTTTNSPSLEPQVGLFVDGVYVGSTTGVLTDQFDLAGIEVLRGPQGVLFGKNVVGGAVLLRTGLPTNEFHLNTMVSFESRNNVTTSLVVSGPIASDVLDFKVAGYFNKDPGYFRNIGTGGHAGGSTTKDGRIALRYTPADKVEVILRYERNVINSDENVAIQNPTLFPNSNDFTVSSTPGAGFTKSYFDNFTVEANIDTAFGNGKITNIAGWRDSYHLNGEDVDGMSPILYQQIDGVTTDQYSDELRYAGSFGRFDITTGLFFYTNYIQFDNDRNIDDVLFLTGGGNEKQYDFAEFISTDWHIVDTFTINAGVRNNRDIRKAQVATFAADACDTSSIRYRLNCNYDFFGSTGSNGVLPKAGFQWKPIENTQVYGFWAKGLRGGGYDLLKTVPTAVPGPYADEKSTDIELGIKSILLNDLLEINLAGYDTKITNLQRSRFQVSALGPDFITGNVGNATYRGVEFDTTIRPTDGLAFTAFVGTIDAFYTKVTADLNQDGVVDRKDVDLAIVRAPKVSAGTGISYERSTPLGAASGRLNYGYRSKQAYNDENTGWIPPQSQLDGSITLRSQEHLEYSVYGKNITNHKNYELVAPLPAALGSGISVIDEGRVIGVSVRYKY